jgi:hypothetical protein
MKVRFSKGKKISVCNLIHQDRGKVTENIISLGLIIATYHGVYIENDSIEELGALFFLQKLNNT